jgi:hypothetical protein
MLFIDYYIGYIKYKINGTVYRNRSLNKCREDAEQFVILNLLKMYSKRYKYTDWDFVVKTAIRRKINDYFRGVYKKDNNLIFEIDIIKDYEENINNDIYVDKKKKNDKIEHLDYVKYLFKRLNDYSDLGKEFNEWEREYLEIIIELYEYDNDITNEDIMECMGLSVYDKPKFSIKQRNFNKKIKNIIMGENGDRRF